MQVILFDVDNTLYDEKKAKILHEVDYKIERFICENLPTDVENARYLRDKYYHDYGATLTGLQKHHKVDATEFLVYTHNLEAARALKTDEELNQMLHEINYRKVIFTNSPLFHTDTILDRLGINHHFEEKFTIDSMDYHVKPHPRSFEITLETLNIKGEDCMLVDDNPANIMAADRFNITTILVNHKRTGKEKFYLESIYDLKSMLNQTS